MKKLLNIQFLLWAFVFISCNGNRPADNILGLPWGIGYEQALELIAGQELPIYGEQSNEHDPSLLHKYGPRRSFFTDAQFGEDDAKYYLAFHSDRFAVGIITINYGDIKTIPKKNNALVKSLKKKYGKPKKIKDNSLYTWEKDGVFVTLKTDTNSPSLLSYANENYYNSQVLERYQKLEDEWVFNDHPRIFRMYLGGGTVYIESYIEDEQRGRRIQGIVGPFPYTVTGNKILVENENGPAEEWEYTLDRNSLILKMGGETREYSRVP